MHVPFVANDPERGSPQVGSANQSRRCALTRRSRIDASWIGKLLDGLFAFAERLLGVAAESQVDGQCHNEQC